MNILLVTMCMNIGGAETHVLELAKELKKRNNNVYVVSNGGEYVEELNKEHIEHISAPLHNKNMINMVKSYKIVEKVIKEKEIDIVHSHARIPSLVSGIVCKTKKIPFVTTAHGVYRVSPLLKLITNWGQKTLSVSEDIKEYLIREYNINEKDITLTVNGIDTNRFSKDINANELINELKLDKEKTTIVHVSRLDKAPAVISDYLINIAKEIQDKAQIIIVGNGTEYLRILQKAKECNSEIGHETVIMTGARTDVNKFLSLADIFVGVSRAALEALSSEVPTILAGAEGYIGIFDDSNLNKSIETNFCCRGLENVAEELIKRDILTLLQKEKEEKEKLGIYGREIVQKYYSIEKMTDDSIRVYKDIL